MRLAHSPETASRSSGTASRLAEPFFSRLPRYTYLGAVLNLLAWVSSWARIGPWAYTFFPLWLSFILVLDGLNVARTGTSLLTRSRGRFVLLFLFSVPFWWTFEVLNVPVQNWHYRLDQPYTWLGYNAISSIDFSTVLPAVLEIAELLAGFALLRPRRAPTWVGPRVRVRTALALFGVGILMVALAVAFPRYAFGLLWLCLAFLLDPINNRAGRKSILAHLLTKDYRFIAMLALAAIICGFFWEMWNYWALPGWYYTVPFVDAAPHLFEMPLPGYLGYLPFGVELFCMYQFALLVTRQRADALVF
ncbi:MAG: hypothetical protein IVW57_03100 [Ktedonobacterales bacterium]|nr:hypothetical protein [Ktedonobacterales bacterium]